jgi:uroporphyrin-III C-methyltransferase/precorrin-2 dehydrogenase/sirohydrochlorin ferrochelatase
MTGRGPEDTPAPIAPLANLPLFHRLAGRRAVVVGVSDAALWKAELLAAAGAEVVLLSRGWTPQHLERAAIAIADLDDRDEAQRFIGAARAAGAIVNIVDQPGLCDVQFGAIVNRSPLVIGISTDGAAPKLGQSIRARIESVLPLGLTSWAIAGKAWRSRLKHVLTDFAERGRFWDRFVAAAWQETNRIPSEADFNAFIQAVPKAKGRVTLVGAGPGDAELLTLKAVRALQTATVILYDDLVGPDILELARREARRIAVGKRGKSASYSQSEINARMVELALAGESVVRLKGGDPLIFGRAREEIDACRKAGIDVLVVPGISAAQGAAASLLLSLTERRQARRVQFVTGHGADGKLPDDLDWQSIADAKATTVIYMPRRTLRAFVRRALSAGLDPATPAVAIASATLPGEEHLAGTVAAIPELANELPAGAPVTIIVGWVARELARSAVIILPLTRAAS